MYRSHKKPTTKQLKVLALLQENPRMTPTQAGRLAGYAPSTIRTMKRNVLSKPIVQSLLDNYRYQLSQHNINPERLAKKLDQLLDAKDVIVDRNGVLTDEEGNTMYKEDRKAQVEAIKLLHEVYNVKAERTEGLKRRMTLEEFEEKELL